MGKLILALLVAFGLTFSVAGCEKKEEPIADKPEIEEVTEEAEDVAEEAEEEAEDAEKAARDLIPD